MDYTIKKFCAWELAFDWHPLSVSCLYEFIKAILLSNFLNT